MKTKSRKTALKKNAHRLLRTFLANSRTGSEDTRRAKLTDLDRMCRFAEWWYETETGEYRDFKHVDLVTWLLSTTRGEAAHWSADFAAWLLDPKQNEKMRYASKTRKRTLSHLRSMLKLAHEVELIEWLVLPPLPKAVIEHPQDPPGSDVIRAMIYNARDRGDGKGFRDAALFGLMFHAGLRGREICTLRLERVNSWKKPPTVQIEAKGMAGLVEVSVLEDTMGDILRWISERGETNGPLFTSYHRAEKWRGEPLAHRGLQHVVEEYAKRVDYKGPISPHRFRHAGVTDAMIRVNGNLALMMAYSRHSDPADLLVYYDRHRYQQDRYAAMQAIATGQLVEQDAEFTLLTRHKSYGR